MTATPQPQQQVTVIGQICKAIEKMKSGTDGSLEERLQGTGVSVENFIAVAKTAVQSHTDQKGLESANRATLYTAIQKAASDGLLPDNREAALVIYNVKVSNKGEPDKWEKQVQYQPMVQGLIKLARKSKEIKLITASVVYSKDVFRYNPATMEMPDFEPDWFGDRGTPVGVWSMIKLTNGEIMNEMMTAKQINRKSSASKVPKNYNVEEGRDWEEWWKKMGIRNILKLAPRSTALEQALEKDNNEFIVDEEVPQQQQPINPVSEKPKTETRAAALIKGSTKPAATKPAEEAKPDPTQGQGEVIDATYTETNSENGSEEEEEIPV